MAVVLARVDHQKARKVVEAINAAVNVPVQFWSHSGFLAAAAHQANWSNGRPKAMSDRYLHA